MGFGRIQETLKIKPNRVKSERSCQCLYMFLTTQSKKPNLRRRLNHVPINQIVPDQLYYIDSDKVKILKIAKALEFSVKSLLRSSRTDI